MEFIQDVTGHEGNPAAIHVTSSYTDGVTLSVRDADGRLLGRLQLKPVVDGYQVCLQEGDYRQIVPFIDRLEEGVLLQDILPAYRNLLSGRTYAILIRPTIREMPVSEFLTLLRESVEVEVLKPGPYWRGSRYFKTFYSMGFGIGPKTVQELIRVFLGERGSHGQ
jgi:hypothetical protein